MPRIKDLKEVTVSPDLVRDIRSKLPMQTSFLLNSGLPEARDLRSKIGTTRQR